LTDFYRAVENWYIIVTGLFYPGGGVVDSMLAQFWAVPRNVLKESDLIVTQPVISSVLFFRKLFYFNIKNNRYIYVESNI
jgi:hypothetical protein